MTTPNQPNTTPAMPPIAAIAASAGGLAATKRLLQHMPHDSGIAMVVIHHLSPEHESLIPELLQAVTEIEVSEVNEPVRPAPDHIYTIPPDRYLEFKGGFLTPVKPTAQRGHRMAVDHFLRSLARNSGSRAMCVILSGTGTDGSLGLKEINEAGGLVLAQNPGQAEFKGMPVSAISTQMVDRVLDAEQIPEFLVDFLRNGHMKQASVDEGSHLIQDHLDEILNRVRKQVGQDFSRYKKATLMRRIHRRMALARISAPKAYRELLDNDPEEVQALFRDLLISVTCFFRDTQVFEHFARDVLPGLCNRLKDHEPLRVWVPGVATGEEAYTLAVIIQEHFLQAKRPCSVVIFATDIDNDALNTAREGRYPRSIEHDVSPERLERFFVPEGDHYRVNRDTRQMVTFAEQNILTDPPYSRLDMISCRNLMIYLGQPVQQKTLALFHFALKPDGVLLLGPSETVGRHMNHLFKPIHQKGRIYRRIGASRRLKGLMPPSPTERLADVLSPRKKKKKSPEFNLEDAARQAVLEHNTICAVAVDRNMTVLYVFGKSAPYLAVPTGRMQNILPLMAANGLQIRVRQVLQKVIFQNEAEAVATGRLTVDENDYRVTITARPLGEENSGLYICLFDRREILPPLAPDTSSSEAEANRRIAELEYTLKENREELSSTIEELEMSNEELRASNEEIISINEELQSSSEELETSKEVLQSLNEELTTLNQQLQDKVDELTHAHDDMANLLTSTEIATVFLDPDLNIRQTTAPADRLLNTRPGDRGRPLRHFAATFETVDLLKEAEQVLAGEEPMEQEVRTRQGHWYVLRVLPYRTAGGNVNGVVLTMVDIDRLKQVQNELEDREQRLRLALEGGHMGTWDFDLYHNRIQWDRRMCDLYGIGPGEAPQAVDDFYNLLHPDDASAVTEQVNRAVHETGIFDTEFRIRTPDGTARWLAGRGRVFYDEDGRPDRMLGVNFDITDRKQADEQLQQLNEELEERVRQRTEALQRSREEIRHLAHLASTAEERERRRIAEGLHDDVQQLLAACIFSLQNLKREFNGDGKQKHLERVLDWTARALDATRSLIFDLSPAVLYEMGLNAAVNHLADQIRQRFNFEVEVDLEQAIDPLPEDLRVFLYSSIRELVLNIIKHADVDHARLWMTRRDNRIRLQMTDHGRGFTLSEVKQMQSDQDGGSGLGLRTIRERLASYGGELELTSAPGEGTNIFLTVPAGEEPSETGPVSVNQTETSENTGKQN